MNGWNLEKAKIVPPPQDAQPGVHFIAAANGELVSNHVPFALDTLPDDLAPLLADLMSERDPQAELILNSQCPDCKQTFDVLLMSEFGSRNVV